MALIPGVLGRETLGGVESNPYLTNAFWEFKWVDQFDPSPYVSEAGPSVNGPAIKHWPVEANGKVIPGSVQRSFADDWYHRIHILPDQMSLGNIASRQEFPVEIWNANLVPVTLVDIDGLEDGLLVEGQPSPPLVFPAMAQRGYQVVVLPDGDPVLDAIISWVFSSGRRADVRVLGSRSKTWTFEPNWPPSGQSYQVTYEFKTEIITSHSGKEQRIALRTSPRKSISYKGLVFHDAFRHFKDLLRGRQHLPFVLPELTRSVRSAAIQRVGEAEMVLDPMPNWALPEAQVLVTHDGRNDVRVIDSVAGNVVTFLTTAAEDWPEGSRVCPGLSGHLSQTISAPRQTNAVAQYDLQFDVTPLSEPVIAPGPAPEVFNGREVFLRRPNWARPVEAQAGHEVSILDFDRGPVSRFTPVAFGYETYRATYLSRNRDEAEAIREFFLRMRGRQGEFYMPTWECDFIPVETAPASSERMVVSGEDFGSSYADSTVYRAVFVLMNDGSLIFREVVGIEAQDDNWVISVSEAWGVDIDRDAIVMCGWMPVCRLVSDNLLIEWLTDSVANIQLNIMTLEDLPD